MKGSFNVRDSLRTTIREEYAANVWIIMPFYFEHKIFSQKQVNLMKKSDIRTQIKIKNLNSLTRNLNTIYSPKKFFFYLKFTKKTFASDYNKSKKQYTLIRLSSKKYDFNNEQIFFQIKKNNKTEDHFELDLKEYRNQILHFSDFLQDKNDKLFFFEKQIFIIQASFVYFDLIEAIKSSFISKIQEYKNKVELNQVNIKKVNDINKNIFCLFFNLDIQKYLTKQNFELFYIFLDLTVDLFIKFCKKDFEFQTALDKFVKSQKNYLKNNNLDALDMLYKFENQLKSKKNVKKSNKLIDQIRAIVLKMQNKKELVKMISDDSLRELIVSQKDVLEIVIHFMSIKRHISFSDKAEFEALVKFTKNLNTFKGKLSIW